MLFLFLSSSLPAVNPCLRSNGGCTGGTVCRYTGPGRRECGCESCTAFSCYPKFADLSICPVILGDRTINQASATSLVNPALTRAKGQLYIWFNPMLNRINFPSLSYVGGNGAKGLEIGRNFALTHVDLPSLTYVGGHSLRIWQNSLLTFVSLASLSQVQGSFWFCANQNDFVAPQLTSVTRKDQVECIPNNGPSCTSVACP